MWLTDWHWSRQAHPVMIVWGFVGTEFGVQYRTNNATEGGNICPQQDTWRLIDFKVSRIICMFPILSKMFRLPFRWPCVNKWLLSIFFYVIQSHSVPDHGELWGNRKMELSWDWKLLKIRCLACRQRTRMPPHIYPPLSFSPQRTEEYARLHTISCCQE